MTREQAIAFLLSRKHLLEDLATKSDSALIDAAESEQRLDARSHPAFGQPINDGNGSVQRVDALEHDSDLAALVKHFDGAPDRLATYMQHAWLGDEAAAAAVGKTIERHDARWKQTGGRQDAATTDGDDFAALSEWYAGAEERLLERTLKGEG